jgi:hypothetical protein
MAGKTGTERSFVAALFMMKMISKSLFKSLRVCKIEWGIWKKC